MKKILALVTASVLCFGMTISAFAAEASSTASGSDLLAGADLHIDFEDTVDDLNGNYAPTYEGEANFVEGRFGKAANAKGGTSHVAVEGMKFGEESFTITTWIKINNWSSDPAIFGNKDWDSGSNPGFLLIPRDTSLKLNANVVDGERTDIAWMYERWLPENPSGMNEWFFMAFVVDREAGTWGMSINGGKLVTKPLAYETGTLDDSTNDLPFRIGEEGTGHYNEGTDFDVDYDEFAIFKEVLSLEEIQAVYTYAPEGYEPAELAAVEETAEESQPAEESESAATEEAQTPVEETQAPVEEAQESNTGLVVGVIVVIAAVAVGGVLVAKKKKK